MRKTMLSVGNEETHRLSDWPESKYKPSKWGNLNISGLRLISLDGCADHVFGSFDASDNKLHNLVGGPTIVDGDYRASLCRLKSLDGIPIKIGGYLSLGTNLLASLQGINQLKEMNGFIHLDDCPITSHILGVFFIKGCRGINVFTEVVDFDKAINIVNKHIGKGRAGLLPCQKELIEAGLADFAQI
jgi:hypothetical protein